MQGGAYFRNGMHYATDVLVRAMLTVITMLIVDLCFARSKLKTVK